MDYYSCTNCEFSVQHTRGLLTTPTLLAYADVTEHAQAPCRIGSKFSRTAPGSQGPKTRPLDPSTTN